MKIIYKGVYRIDYKMFLVKYNLRYGMINKFSCGYKTWSILFPFVDFDKTPKIKPGRWGNVGGFIDDDKKKNNIEDWNSVTTTQDHCGDIICGEKDSILKAQDIIIKTCDKKK